MLFIVFFIMVTVVFAIVAIATRPTSEEKAVVKRMALITVAATGASGSDPALHLLKAHSDGSFGWLEDLIERFSIAQWLQVLILQSASTMTSGSIMAWSGGLAIGGFLFTYLFTRLLFVAVLAAAAMAYIPIGSLSFKRKRRLNAFDAALAEAIDMMARSLRAGHSMVSSIGVVSEHAKEPVSTEFAEVFRKQNFGLPLRDALMQMLDRIPSQDLRVVVTGILVQKDTGGNLAEILDRTTHVIRERIRIRGEIRTHTAQGRMTGWILCALPIVMLVLINLINPGYSKVLFEPGFGRILLYIGIALLFAGGFIIRKIVNGIEV